MQYPIQRVCGACQTLDQYEPVRLVNRPGRIYAYTKDYFSGSADPPTVVTVVDVKGGARFYTALTDRDPDAVKLDMPVEFTFRRLREGAAFHNYHWRARPVRS